MRFLILSTLASAALAAPTPRQAAITDADILQFALTLEHLENVFYKQGLEMTEADFVAAGFSTQYYDNLKYIAHDEEAHVELLTAGLTAAGASPVKACTYKFPFTDAKSFVTLASVLEGVGSAAYLGAAPAIQNKEYLTVAGSILVTEAIHTSLQRFAVGEVAPASPYGSSLIPDAVYTLAASFIESCPASNGALPFTAFPSLTAVQGQPTAPGLSFLFQSEATPSGEFFVTFVNGLVQMSEPATLKNGLIVSQIPTTVSGQTYALVTNTNVTTGLTDADVISGPAILEVTPSSPTYNPSIQ